MDSRIFELVGNKPELIRRFPDWMLPATLEKEIAQTPGLAIVEIAGRDSVAAAFEAISKRKFRALLPTIAYTGTEFGNWEIPFEKTEALKDALIKRGVTVFPPILMGAPRLWRHLCGRYATHLFKTFGFYSPCVGCHLYLHALRIPLAIKTGCSVIIGGERESHEGKIKINQIGVALDAYEDFAGRFGVELFLPLREIAHNQDIAAIIQQPWEEGAEQMGCVLSKNYLERDGNVVFSEDAVGRFFREFALGEAETLIRTVLEPE